MDSHTNSAPGRLEVIEMGRRRRWSNDEKLRIVLESLSGPRLVSATARRHRISRSLLVLWRRSFLAKQRQAGSVPGFIHALIVPEPTHVPMRQSKPDPQPGRSYQARIEIVLANGRRVFGLSRETVLKMCRFSLPPGYTRTKPPAKPKLGPLLPVIDAILEADRDAPPKQRHSAKRIFERLRDEHGFVGGYTVVKDHVRVRTIKTARTASS